MGPAGRSSNRSQEHSGGEHTIRKAAGFTVAAMASVLALSTLAPEAIAQQDPPAPPAVEAATPPPAVEKAPEIAAAPAWRIQLVSLSSQKDAEAEWARLQKANDDLLGGLELQVQTAKLSKGTFYRVQAGPLPNRAAAASLCGTLKSRKQDCLVVAPKR